MDSFLEKISAYNIFNYIIPGAVFCYFFNIFFLIDIGGKGIIYNICLFYFWGMMASRIGSLFLEKISIRTGFVKYAPYNDYLKACFKNAELKLHMEINNMFRTFASVFLCFIFIEIFLSLINLTCTPLVKKFPFNALFFIFSLFIFSIMMLAYKKQTSYIVKKINYELS